MASNVDVGVFIDRLVEGTARKLAVERELLIAVSLAERIEILVDDRARDKGETAPIGLTIRMAWSTEPVRFSDEGIEIYRK